MKMFKEFEHAKMFCNGDLYCKPLSCFREIEDHTGRKDKLEGKVPQPEIIRIHINGVNYDLANPTERPPLFSIGSENVNLFCMSLCEIKRISKEESGLNLQLNEEIAKLGPHFVVVSNYDEFSKRFCQSMTSKNYKSYHRHMEYYDIKKPPRAGEIKNHSAFYKPNIFKNQQEYRFLIYTGSIENDLLITNIGDISDITLYLNIDDLKRI